MIALKDQLFSVWDGKRFSWLMYLLEPRYSVSGWCCFAYVSLPALYDLVSTHIHWISDVSFTTYL